MSRYHDMNSQRLLAHFKKLEGKTIARAFYTPPEGDIEGAFGLHFTDGTVAYILSDEEGNDVGFLEIAKGKMGGPA